MYGSYIGTLYVYKVPVSGSLREGEVIFTRSGQQTDERTWLEAELYISNVTSDFRIAIVARHQSRHYGSYSRGDIAIDDVQAKAPCADCNFESNTCGWSQSTEDDTDWMCQQEGPTESDGTGPEFDRTIGGRTGHYCYLEASSPRSAGDNAVLLSGTFEYNPDYPGLTWFINFWYNMHGNTIGTLNVYQIPVNGTLGEANRIFSRAGEQTNGTTWLPAEINITDITWSFSLAIEAVRGSDYQGDIAIDDITTNSQVLPTSMNLSDSNAHYSTGDTSYLVNGTNHRFKCLVPDINPGASFIWTLAGQVIPQDTTTHTGKPNFLTTSTSYATLSVDWSMHGESLKCHASSHDGHSGVEVTIYLDVQVPPVASSLSLYDSTGTILGPTADVIHGIPHTFSCEALGTRPAPIIEWYLDDTLQHTSYPTDEADAGLVNTTATWTFAPNWANHVEVVKCVARTAASRDPYPSISVTLAVFAYPATITLSDSTGNFQSTGGTAYIVEGLEHQFTCVVPNIDPGASFAWTIGDQHITANTNNHDTGTHGLTTSTSVAHVVPTGAYNGLVLKCKASNEDGHPGISISITLDVRVPPKVSAMSLHDSSGPILGETAEVYQGIATTFICEMLIRQTAVTIKWYLDNMLQRTVVQPLAAGDGFVNTTGNWSFTPSRDNQGQEVRCEASTAESLQPYPSVMVTLHVNVPPTSIVLSDFIGIYPSSGGVAYLVEGADREFTCMVPEIDPQASFNWTVGSQDITLDYITNVTDVDGLMKSTSVATVSVTGSNHGEVLMCLAWNTDFLPSINISVLLDVKAPPKASLMAMYDSSGKKLHAIASVKPAPVTFTCEVQGTRPGATIEWFLDDQSQRNVSAPSGGGDGIVNTNDTWSFTPNIANLGQEVKCVASTAESQQPFPFVAVTLDVFALPETIYLSDSTTNYTSTGDTSYVVAGVGHQFTCEVPAINPGASFVWTLGGQHFTPDRNIHDEDDDGLITSTSIATVVAVGSNHGQTLQCSASNEDGAPGITTSVTLHVKVPPVPSGMSLYDFSGNQLQSTVRVAEGTPNNFTCVVRGTRPAADISWFIGDDVQVSVGPPVTGSDNLVNTSATFTFIPSRADNGLELKCVASTPDSQQPFPSASVSLDVSAPPTNLFIVDSAGTYSSSGGTAYLVEGEHHRFTCEARDIDVDASFTWLLGGGEIMPDNSTDIESTEGWTNRTSSVTVKATASQHGKMLLCSVSNEDGGVEISTGVMLYVKVPPKASSMLLYDTDGARLVGVVDVDQGVPTAFRCETQGTRPAPMIEWFLNDVSQRIKSPPSGGGEGLVNATDTWTFTPNRTNHRQEVKCVASTAESQQTLPFVAITLNVNGPPDTPRIIGSFSMIEDTPVYLECQASMGFPSDWSLHWFNGDYSLPSYTSYSMLQDNRYTLTTSLLFTPTRDNNRDTIRCVAQRDEWPTSPESSVGPLDVQFCTRMVSMTGCPRRVVSGGAVSLSCVTESTNPATNLTWTRDDAELTNRPHLVIADGDYSGQVTTLEFATDALTRTDNGAVYMCCATRERCSDVCESCALNVQYHPYFSEPTASPPGAVEEGANVSLSCSADANPEPPDFIAWEKVRSADSLSSVYSDGSSTLTLRSVSREQAGPYRCLGNNGIPPVVYSNQINVAVHYGVNITNKGTDNLVESSVGENALMVCVVKGNPLPLITWTGPSGAVINNQTDPGRIFQVNTLTGGDDVYGKTVRSILHITRVTGEGDYGYYSCNSGNSIGMVDTLRIQLIKRGIATTLSTVVDVTTTTAPQVDVETTKPSVGVSSTNLPTTVAPTTASPVVTTAMVPVTSTAAAPSQPSPPQQVSSDQNRTSHDSITVTWIPGNDGGSPQWFYVNYRDFLSMTDFDPSTRSDKLHDVTEYTLVGLRPFTVYEIEVYAENAIGASQTVTRFTATLRVATTLATVVDITTTLPGLIDSTTAPPVDVKTTTPSVGVGSTATLPTTAAPTTASPVEVVTSNTMPVSSTAAPPSQPSPPQQVSSDQNRTSHDSITVTWIPGNDGGSPQWFYVNYRDFLSMTDFDPSTRSNRLHGVTEYTLVGLRPFTVYEIEVYAENAIGASEPVTFSTATLQKPTGSTPCASCAVETTTATGEKVQPTAASPGDKTTAVKTGGNVPSTSVPVGDKTTAVKVGETSASPGRGEGVGQPQGISALIAIIVILAIIALISIVVAVVLYRKRRAANHELELPNKAKKKKGRGKRDEENNSVVTETVEFSDLEPDENVTSFA
ncbi:hemicentin-1-like [Patiria miniata]|uniref:Uncharacterized protein n=1 Tax=Patiria miniata TaxID=46514 RepID=A0A914AR84_PATMI|nr:hemicentin-1-like [Patiria miniata]